MSRTIKGQKGVGWEPWSNRHEKAEQKANYREPASDPQDDEACGGCRLCICVKCGGRMAAFDTASGTPDAHCPICGHEERAPANAPEEDAGQ